MWGISEVINSAYAKYYNPYKHKAADEIIVQRVSCFQAVPPPPPPNQNISASEF
jgi:hypothetical protein